MMAKECHESRRKASGRNMAGSGWWELRWVQEKRGLCLCLALGTSVGLAALSGAGHSLLPSRNSRPFGLALVPFFARQQERSGDGGSVDPSAHCAHSHTLTQANYPKSIVLVQYRRHLGRDAVQYSTCGIVPAEYWYANL
jgi:hypothetical protein